MSLLIFLVLLFNLVANSILVPMFSDRSYTVVACPKFAPPKLVRLKVECLDTYKVIVNRQISVIL